MQNVRGFYKLRNQSVFVVMGVLGGYTENTSNGYCRALLSIALWCLVAREEI